MTKYLVAGFVIGMVIGGLIVFFLAAAVFEQHRERFEQILIAEHAEWQAQGLKPPLPVVASPLPAILPEKKIETEFGKRVFEALERGEWQPEIFNSGVNGLSSGDLSIAVGTSSVAVSYGSGATYQNLSAFMSAWERKEIFRIVKPKMDNWRAEYGAKLRQKALDSIKYIPKKK